jgi:hypothetical protein
VYVVARLRAGTWRQTRASTIGMSSPTHVLVSERKWRRIFSPIQILHDLLSSSLLSNFFLRKQKGLKPLL